MAGTLKEQAQKLLAKVPDEYVFRCQDGRVLRDMKEMAEALATMTDETFAYHSNAEKRDFSRWVRDIIGDEKLAKDLRKATDRAQATKQATTRVATLTKRLT